MEGSIFVTAKGFESLRKRKEDLIEKLKNIQMQKGEAAKVGGNEWHDNFAFEDLCRQEDMLNKQIIEINKEISLIEIVEDDPADNSVLRIGLVVDLHIEEKEELVSYEVRGHGESDLNAVPKAIAYDAPILRPFFLREEGTSKKVSIGGKLQTVTVEKIYFKEEYL